MQRSLMNELWQDVPRWEGLYEVSSHGRCRSVSRWLERRNKSRELYRYFRKGQLLKPKHVDCGNGTVYLRVTLCLNRKSTYRLIHRLMWEAFNGPVPDGMYVLHGPAKGRKERHFLSNLYLGTHAQNMGADRLRDGTDNRGSKHGASKLTEEDVLFIRQYPTGYGTGKELCQLMGVSDSVISSVRKCKAWAHL